MSFLYPRTIAIKRPGGQSGVGFQPGHAGSDDAGETSVATDLPASIQARREGQRTPVGLPSDATGTMWTVFIPKASAELGLIQQHDIVVDDLGERYQVVAPYWDSLGYALIVMNLSA